MYLLFLSVYNTYERTSNYQYMLVNVNKFKWTYNVSHVADAVRGANAAAHVVEAYSTNELHLYVYTLTSFNQIRIASQLCTLHSRFALWVPQKTPLLAATYVLVLAVAASFV